MQAREQIRVSAAGNSGTHGAGPGDYPSRPLEAQFAIDGLHGQSATRPSAGTHAGNINARLAYMEDEPGLVQVAGEGGYTGKVWKVSRDQELFLDCRGGDGGRGGRGEDGQQGGKGVNGRNATKYRDAEHGGRGCRGGDAGHGTNGADGGNAGNVFLTVGEDELDLLMAVTWDTSGGRGGASGTHGMPGDGGIGGDGGQGCSWTERHGNTTTTYNRPAGMPGHVGIPGSQPAVYLTGGNSGHNGSTQIRVLRKDNTEATYPGCYKLEVVSFDVLDENEDGINEPGEHLLVRNIKVVNKGSMPSPNSATPISILIQGTQWLEPVELEPVIVPFCILPGDTVEVPGTTRAFIRNETSPRAPGVPLRVQDQVTLIATFAKRLVRSIPGFSGSQIYNIGYPLELTPPKCLDCVQKGDRVRFSWVLRNVSRKTYGLPENGTGRYAATRFSDPERIFELPYKDTTDANAPHEATDAVEEIEPGQEVHIEQDFIVSNTAFEYSDGKLHIELLFADPHAKQQDGTSTIRKVMIYEINMQIAGVYQYDPLSRYLLVVNAKTPNYAIHQMIGFIRKELKLGLDIFNLSISGNYIDAANRPVLQSYEGKSVLVYGNAFDYFGKGLRNPWDLMDSWELCSLAKAGTSFSFLGVSNVNDLQSWAANITFSVVTSSKETTPAGLLDNLIGDVQGEDQTKWTSDIPLRQFKGQDSFISKLGECTCFSATTSDKIAQKASKKLTKSLPLRRFLAVPDASSTDAKEPNIFLIEGLSKSTFVVASMVTPPENPGFVLADHHKYAILAALPFANLARLFWNAWGASTPDAAGAPWFPTTRLYAGTGWQETQSLVWDGTMLEQKILHMIILSIETRLGSEVDWFLAGKAPSKDSLRQLPNLATFFNTPQGSGQLQTVPEHDVVVMALGTILGSLIRIGFGQWFNTLWSSKKALKVQVDKQIGEVLARVCAPATATSMHKATQAQAKLVKKEIKAAGKEKNLSLLVHQRLVKLAQVDAGFTDLVALNPGSISVTLQGLEEMRLAHGGRAGVRQQFESHAKDVIQVHVNPDVEDSE